MAKQIWTSSGWTGTVEHESMGTRHDNRALAARLADFLQPDIIRFANDQPHQRSKKTVKSPVEWPSIDRFPEAVVLSSARQVSQYRTKQSDQLAQLAGFNKNVTTSSGGIQSAQVYAPGEMAPPGIPDMPVEDIDRRLELNERFLVPGGSASEGAVVRVDVSELASNDPTEDRHIELALMGGGTLFGVFDGHADVHCANHLTALLPAAVRLALESNNSVGQALSEAFVAVDDHLLSLPFLAIPGFDTMTPLQIAQLPASERTKARKMILPALAGSCAVMAHVGKKDVHVAHAGDSRVVLGSLSNHGVWEATTLTSDHQACNPKEIDALRRAHPNEIDTVAFRHCEDGPLRVIGGLMPTRAFGDARYKWTLDVQEKVSALMHGLPSQRRQWPMLRYCISPPYIHAKPDIYRHTLTSRDHFLVIASDGLFEELTSEQVVDIVGDFLLHAPPNPTATSGIYEIRHVNIATHLLRQALKSGRYDDTHVSRLLTLSSSESRNWRDDMVIQIVLFEPAVKYLTENSKLVPKFHTLDQ
ncbi:hypothetical protein BASA50_010107 [Batrachochytrium salamandrivorans]|uniref:PPM-type phosphatase domain-containing protein n=1 Tax=Batrachochytrium salamandrivorans TaxID=1357716 RepID=A0ABQ8F2J4_9FUNG|nr:hypothetical protein BASA50_010107 [Batrachochytrium salamandrivorans]